MRKQNRCYNCRREEHKKCTGCECLKCKWKKKRVPSDDPVKIPDGVTIVKEFSKKEDKK